jgi:hypothetical protein
MKRKDGTLAIRRRMAKNYAKLLRQLAKMDAALGAMLTEAWCLK